MPQLSTHSLLGFPLILGSLLLSSLPLRAQPQANPQLLPPPPDTGTPTGRSTPGTTRPETTCPSVNLPLTALMANNGSDLTHVAYPTLWFYVPYTAAQVSRLEFLLLNRQETETVYQTVIQLQENRPGIIKVTVPPQPQFALEPEQTYRWYLNLDCQPDRTTEPDLVVDGWMRRRLPSPNLQARVLATPERAHLIYQEEGLWYDAIDHLAQRSAAQPRDRTRTQTWVQFMDPLGHGQVAQTPFIKATSLLSID